MSRTQYTDTVVTIRVMERISDRILNNTTYVSLLVQMLSPVSSRVLAGVVASS